MRHWTSVFSRGAIKPPPTLVPLLPWSSWRANNIVACPPHYHPSRNDPASLEALWEISKENVLVYYRNLGSLRYGTSPAFLHVLWAARLSRFLWRNLRRGGEEMPFLSWRAMAGCIAIGSRTAAEPFVCFLVLHEPMDVQLHCVIKKRLQLKRKKLVFPKQRLSTQYEWNIKREQLFLRRDHEKMIAYCILWIF